MDEVLWKNRVLEEHIQELEEFKLVSQQQIDFQREKLEKNLSNQLRTNKRLEEHSKKLDEEIRNMKSLLSQI